MSLSNNWNLLSLWLSNGTNSKAIAKPFLKSIVCKQLTWNREKNSFLVFIFSINQPVVSDTRQNLTVESAEALATWISLEEVDW